MLIRIKSLEIPAIIGIYEEERTQPQPVVINAEITYKEGQNFSHDTLENAIDYEALTEDITQLVTESRFQLLENLAQAILDLMMDDSRIAQAQVEIDKPKALQALNVQSVSVMAHSSY